MRSILPFESKQITYRGGVVVFSVPRAWIEEYEPDGGGLFYEEGPITGTLRLNVVTARSPTPVSALSPTEALLAAGKSHVERLANGNALAKGVSRTVEQGQDITMFWWHLTSAVAPSHVRLAMFTYTVLTALEQSPKTVSDLSFLEQSVSNSRFNSGLGE
jgi:hypothetical protein